MILATTIARLQLPGNQDERSMEILSEWLPRVGAILTVALGLVGFFKPRLITDGQQIELKSPMALSEARVVFGGLHLGSGVMALALQEPLIYMTLGVAWSVGLLARFYSMVADKTSLQHSLPGIVVDAGMAFLFLSGLIF
jgi:hypothetical protein